MTINIEKQLFAQRLVSLCEEKGLPVRGRQAALKKICGLKQQSISKWFNAESIPEYEHCLALCNYFKVKYEWLLTGKGNKRDEPSVLITQRELEISEFNSILRKLADEDFTRVKSVGEDLASYLLQKSNNDPKQ